MSKGQLLGTKGRVRTNAVRGHPHNKPLTGAYVALQVSAPSGTEQYSRIMSSAGFNSQDRETKTERICPVHPTLMSLG